MNVANDAGRKKQEEDERRRQLEALRLQHQQLEEAKREEERRRIEEPYNVEVHYATAPLYREFDPKKQSTYDLYKDYKKDADRSMLSYQSNQSNQPDYEPMTVDKWDQHLKKTQSDATDEQKDLLNRIKNAGSVGGYEDYRRQGSAGDLMDVDQLRKRLRDTGMTDREIDTELKRPEAGNRSMTEQLEYSSDFLSRYSDDDNALIETYLTKKEESEIKGARNGERNNVHRDEAFAAAQEAAEAKKQWLRNTGKTEKEFEDAVSNARYLYDYNKQRQETEQIRANIHTGNAGRDALNAAAYTSTSWLTSVGRGYGAIAETIQGTRDPYAPINTYSNRFGGVNFSNAVQGEVANRLSENGDPNKFDRWDFAAKAYQIGNSIGESATSMALGGMIGGSVGGPLGETLAEIATLPSFGTSAYATTLQEAQERGIDKRDAVLTATAAGIFEMLTEKVSLDHLVDIAKAKGVRALKTALGDVLAQASVEASEEGASEILNRIADGIINGDKSEYNQNVQRYMQEEHMSEAEAKRQASKDWALQLGEAMLGGFVSGGFMGSFGSAIGVHAETKAANATFKKEGSYKGVADKTNPENYVDTKAQGIARETKEYAEKLAKKSEDGKRVTNREKRKLYNLLVDSNVAEGKTRKEAEKEAFHTLISESIDIKEEEVVDRAAAKKYTEKDVEEADRTKKNNLTSDEVAGRIAMAKTGKEIAAVVREADNSVNKDASKTARDMANSYVAKLNRENGGAYQEYITELNRPTNEEVAVAALNNKPVFGASEEQKVIAEKYAAKRQSDIASQRMEDASLAKAAQTEDGEEIQVLGFEKTGEDAVVNTSNGKMRLSDVHTENLAAQSLWNYASEEETPELANAIYEGYGGNNLPVRSYIRAARNIVTLAESGVCDTFEEAKKSTLVGLALEYYKDDSALRKIFEVAKEKAKQEGSISDKSTSTVLKKGTGKIIDERADKTESIDHLEKLLSPLLEVLGLDLTIKDTADFNGSINTAIGMVTLNASAKRVENTAVHEIIGEYCEAYAPEQMKLVQDAVLRFVLKKLSPDQLIRIAERYKYSYREYGRKHNNDAEANKTTRGALNEYVNDAIMGVMSVDNGMEDLLRDIVETNSPKKAKTILEQLRDFFKGLGEKLRNFIKSGNSTEAARDAAMASSEEAAHIMDLLKDAMNTAVVNARSAKIGKEAIPREAMQIYLKESDTRDYLAAGERNNRNRIKRHEKGERITIQSEQELSDWIKNTAIKERISDQMVSFGIVEKPMLQAISKLSHGRINLTDAYWELLSDDIMHAYDNHHIVDENNKHDNLDYTIDELITVLKNMDNANIEDARRYAGGDLRVTFSMRSNDGIFIMKFTASKSAGTIRFKNAWKITPKEYNVKYKNGVDSRGYPLRGNNNSLRSTTVSDNFTISETEQNGKQDLSPAEESRFSPDIDNGSKKAFSIETYEQGGKAYLRGWLKNSGLTEQDQQDILDQLDMGYQLAKDMAGNKDLTSFARWSRTALVRNEQGIPMLQILNNDGRPIQSVVVNNGEYPLNIDFTQVCKKRITLNTVLNTLIEDYGLNLPTLTESDILKVTSLIKNRGFEVACGLCFVDAKRYRVGKWSSSFADGVYSANTGKKTKRGWNDLVRSMLKPGVGASYFNFASEGPAVEGRTLSDLDDSEINFKELDRIIGKFAQYDADGNLTGIGRSKDGKNPTELVRMAYLLRTSPEARHFLDKNDLVASEGLDAMRQQNQDLYRLVNAHWGAGKPKLPHGFTAYGNEILRSEQWGKANNFTPEAAYAVGGVRVQSFSDYVANMFFDYMQMFADMAARKLPSHAYTKELNYVRLFGMTGQKINMSVIPKAAELTEEQQERYRGLSRKGKKALLEDEEFREIAENAGLAKDENGNYTRYIFEDESFDFDEALKIQADPRYNKNCGIIAVGVSDNHIWKMLDDDNIPMIIPYHASGVAQQVAKARNIWLYKDYTSQQTTRDKNGRKVSKDFDWYADLAKTNDPRTTANNYKAWCAERNYTPVFDTFKDHDNYYKLLIDFRVYDYNGVEAGRTQTYQPQGAVSMTFPEDFSKIVLESLKAQQETEQDLENNLTDEQGTLLSQVREALGLPEKQTAAREMSEQESEETAAVMNEGADVAYSVKVEDQETLDFLEGQEYITTYRTFQKIGDGYYAPMNAMENGKLGYKSMLGVWEQATEDPSKVKDGKFPLKAGGHTTSGKSRTTWAAYNPYLHSSNLVFNDQFAGAYDRPNLVVVECRVPVSELTSGYHADQAKDPVGWLSWKSGSVANALKKKGIERKVMLSRWMKPVRELSNAEVAQIYKDTLDGTGIVVPWNVVSPPLREELEKLGVDIDYGYSKQVKASFEDKFPEAKRAYSIDVDSSGRQLTEAQSEYFKDSKARDADGRLLKVYHGTNADFTEFDRSFIGAHGAFEGAGFNFTPSETRAGGYKNIGAGSGRVLGGYLNITKPLSDSGKTMSVRELAALIKKIDPTGDDIISNYARDTRDYGSKSFVDREAMTTAKMLYGYHETDVDLYSELSASGANSDAIIEAFKEMGYDGLIHHYDDGSIKTLIAFDSNQFKLADNQNPTDVADIRYGLEIDDFWFQDHYDDEMEFLDDGSGNVRERGVNYRQESMRSMFPILEEGAAALANEKVSKTLVRKIASDLRSMYGSTYNLNTFADNLQKIFAYIQQNGVTNYEDLLRVLTEVAQPVIDEAQVVVGSREDYDTFRSNLKRYRIKLNAEQKAEVKSAFDTVQNYRNAFGSNAVFRDDGIALDDIWSELCDMSMGMLDYDTSSADQPLALLDAFEALKPTAKNDYGGSNQDMAYDLALQIIERYFEAHHMQELKDKVKAENAKYRKKVQEKYNERLKKYKQQVRQKANDRVQGVRQKANDRIAELKARHRQSVLEAKNRRLASVERGKVKTEAKMLMDMILKPSEKTLKYVPDVLKKPVVEFLNSIDFVSRRAEKNEQERGYASQEVKDWRNRALAMVNVLNQIQNGTSGDESLNAFAYVLDPDLANIMQKWADDHAGAAKISDMDQNALHELKQILRSVRFAIMNANKTYVNARYESVDDMARATIMGLYKREDQKARGYIGRKWYNLRSVQMLDAFSYFEEMGEAAASVMEGIREGFNIRARDMKQAQEYGRGLLKGVDVSSWTGDRAEVKTFQAVEGPIRLTTSQVMSLYCLSKRPQAYNHIMKGGIKANTVKIKGKWTTQGRPVHVSEAQLKAIVDSLTPEQKRIADGFQNFMSTESSKWGNRVTQAMHGFDKFTETNYFPIKTDQNSNAANDQNIENASYRAILNMSAAKQLTPNAMNPIIIDDIFDVFTDHIVQMASYDGMALPIMDAMRWFNYKEVVKMGKGFQHYDTVQQEISRVLGKEGRQYFLNFILDMNGIGRSGYATEFANALVSNYKGYAIGANLRVVMQQPTAYLRASAVMNPKYLAEALPSVLQARKLSKELRDKSMIAWWKSQGYFETAIGQTEKQIITGISTTKDKIRDVSSAAAGLADDLTWGVLYKAVQLEQRDEFKKAGKPAAGKEFEEACIKRFDYIVDHTQVVDSMMHRTQFMRDKDTWSKILSAFMAEPSKSWNMLHRAMVKSLQEGGGKITPESGRHIARAGTTFIMTALLTSAAAAVMDAFRSDDDDDWQQKWLDAFIDNTVDNVDPMNMLPIVKEISPYFERMIMENLFGREYTIYNTNTRMDIDGLKSAAEAVTKLADYARGDFGSKSPYGALKSEIKAFSMLTGIPAYGLLREFETVYNNMVVELTGWSKLSAKAPGKYDAIYKAIDKGDGLKDAAAKLLADTEKSTVAASITRHYKEQYLASRDPQLYNRLVAAYVAIGYDKEDAKKKIDKWN